MLCFALQWMRHSIVRALGGFTTETSRTRILYCGESFDYPELEEHPYLCNHLGELRTFIEIVHLCGQH